MLIILRWWRMKEKCNLIIFSILLIYLMHAWIS
jgi:hypothetical protein